MNKQENLSRLYRGQTFGISPTSTGIFTITTCRYRISLLRMASFVVERLVPRFLPYTAVKTRLPTHPVFVTAYLKVPFVRRFKGHQFLAVARKPSAGGA